jgi:hypothetical protein
MRPLRIALLLVPLCLALPTAASAGTLPSNERPVWFGIGGAGAVAGMENSGVGFFNLTLGLRLLPLVPEVTIREGLGREPTHHLTSIAAGVRILLPKLLMLRVGLRFAFAHQHELLLAKAIADPAGALFGVNPEMTHRSGFETGIGLDVKLDPKGIVGLFGQFNAIFLPVTAGPPFYILGELGLSIAVGPA